MDIFDFDSAKTAILKTIQERCSTHNLQWTNHILLRLFQCGISIDDVTHALETGEIIERYPEDYPHPSYLIFGVTVKNATQTTHK